MIFYFRQINISWMVIGALNRCLLGTKDNTRARTHVSMYLCIAGSWFKVAVLVADSAGTVPETT